MTLQAPIDVQEWFGGIDIYLFDQLLKGRLVPGMRVLDAGCGSGRNLVYFLKSGYEVFAVDESVQAIERLRQLAARLAPHLPRENFKTDAVERIRFEDIEFDVVLSSAVLHFARDDRHWMAMLEAMWRVLKPGGVFFARLASTIGIENQVQSIEGRRYRLPDGSDRFLVDAELLHRVSNELGGEFLEPIKTTVVENMRAMTTWVLRK
ncbi:MAG TPA: class I SAM-dependent methyltransferase [Pyrinomonadaceae bacterium]|nr:class I SAM-dependent methyltransferase [Pyrinomonadaceae bacterium]